MLAGTDPACMVPLAMIVTRTLPVPSVLAAVLARDGITLPGHGAERVIPCFNPHHRDDAAMSMRIDTVRGRYRCYGCGIRGNSWTYLTRIKGLQPQAARALLAELGWPEELFRWSRDWHEEQERVKSGSAKYMDEPCMTVGGRNGVPLARAIAQHVYRLADGRLVGGASEQHRCVDRGPARGRTTALSPSRTPGGYSWTVGRRSRGPLRCRQCREVPRPAHPCLDPRDRRLSGLGIPAGEAQAVPGPGDVRPERSKTERTTPKAPVCSGRRPRKSLMFVWSCADGRL